MLRGYLNTQETVWCHHNITGVQATSNIIVMSYYESESFWAFPPWCYLWHHHLLREPTPTTTSLTSQSLFTYSYNRKALLHGPPLGLQTSRTCMSASWQPETPVSLSIGFTPPSKSFLWLRRLAIVLLLLEKWINSKLNSCRYWFHCAWPLYHTIHVLKSPCGTVFTPSVVIIYVSVRCL